MKRNRSVHRNSTRSKLATSQRKHGAIWRGPDRHKQTAALTQARTSLGFTRIHAPFAGVVTEKKADAGTLASPGMPCSPLKIREAIGSK